MSFAPDTLMDFPSGSTEVFEPTDAEPDREVEIKQGLRAAIDIIGNGFHDRDAPHKVLSDILAYLHALRRDAQGNERNRFTGITAAELDSSTYDLHFLVDDVLVEGEPCIVGGPKKSLKTSVLVDLALAIATGGFFLGKFRVSRPRRVLICSGESGLAALQDTARRVAKAMGRNLADITASQFTLCPKLPRFDNHENLDLFEQFIEAKAAEVVMIDPAYLCMPGADAGNICVQGERLRNISELCQRHGATLILVHHMKSTRGDPYAKPDLDDLSFAGFAEFAAQWILLGKRERYEPGSGEHKLWLSVGGRAGQQHEHAMDVSEGTRHDPDGRHWDVTLTRAEEAHKAAQQRKADAKASDAQSQLDGDRKLVCQFLAKKPEGATQTNIREYSGVSAKRVPTVLATMLKSRELIECEVQVSNHKKQHPGYRLADREVCDAQN